MTFLQTGKGTTNAASREHVDIMSLVRLISPTLVRVCDCNCKVVIGVPVGI